MDQFNQLINPKLCAKNEKNPSKRQWTLCMSLFPHGPILALHTPKGPMGEVCGGPKELRGDFLFNLGQNQNTWLLFQANRMKNEF